MPNQAYNPLQSVDGLTVPSPSKYEWKESDVSAKDAGRTEDAVMHKMMIARKIHLELSWDYLTIAEASTVLTAFTRSEYFQVKYLDAKAGGYLTKTFYVGDRSTPLYNAVKGLWENVSFNIIEQ